MGIFNFLRKENNISYYEDAEKLIEAASTIALINKTTFTKKFPQLHNAANIKDWELYFTIVATYCAVMAVKKDVPVKFQDKIYEIVWNKLDSFHKIAQFAYRDFVNFIETDLSSFSETLTDPASGALHIQKIAGIWLIWNLTDKQPISDENIIAHSLSDIIFFEFLNYWKTK